MWILIAIIVGLPLIGLSCIAAIIGISYVVNRVKTKDWLNE
jgi:hypothetical protein